MGASSDINRVNDIITFANVNHILTYYYVPSELHFHKVSKGEDKRKVEVTTNKAALLAKLEERSILGEISRDIYEKLKRKHQGRGHHWWLSIPLSMAYLILGPKKYI